MSFCSLLNKKYFLGVIAALAISAMPANAAEDGFEIFDSIAQSIPQGNSYVTATDLPIVSRDQMSSNSVLPRGTEVTVLETQEDPLLGTLLHLGVDSDDESLPTDVWVSARDAEAAGLEIAPEGDYDDMDLLARKMTYCYRYVKKYLIKIGKVKSYMPGASAYMAAKTLPQYGFRRTGLSPAQSKINDVCVYRGGRGGNGHIEVRVKGGWYYGYGIKKNPITRKNHPFIGCYRK